MWTGKGHLGNLLDYCLRTVLQMVQAMPIREVVLVVTYSWGSRGRCWVNRLSERHTTLNLLINISPWGFFLQKQTCKDILTAFLPHTDWWTGQKKVPAGEDLGAQCLNTALVYKDISSVHCSCLPVSEWARSLWEQLLWLCRVYTLTGTERNLCKHPQLNIISNGIKISINKLLAGEIHSLSGIFLHPVLNCFIFSLLKM